ncbi:MAG: HIT family protein [Spirochaetales bacterium]|jgi:diadenosine tetraphosphate (Ap4A) HIT family hydrolase|nr:HIT family protein [Spirochaetales bacterium]
MKDTNCRYCTKGEDIAGIVADLEVSTLYLTKDQSYKGRCILALNDHKTELFQLDPEELQAFSRDMARASKALFEVFRPGKINYAAFGDTYPHVHFHLVPKYEGGKSWGSPFELPLSPDNLASKEELDARIKEIKSRL